jgi:hypothetical protein
MNPQYCTVLWFSSITFMHHIHASHSCITFIHHIHPSHSSITFIHHIHHIHPSHSSSWCCVVLVLSFGIWITLPLMYEYKLWYIQTENSCKLKTTLEYIRSSMNLPNSFWHENLHHTVLLLVVVVASTSITARTKMFNVSPFFFIKTSYLVVLIGSMDYNICSYSSIIPTCLLVNTTNYCPIAYLNVIGNDILYY